MKLDINLIEKLVDEAWAEHDSASISQDLDGMRYWKEQAFELLEKLPTNEVFIKNLH